MGHSHAVSTTAIALACAAPLSAELGYNLTAAGAIAFAGVAGGFGVLPDLDDPGATLARTLGPVTKTISKVVRGLAGGHRKGTHTIWFAAGMVALVTFLPDRLGLWAQGPVIFIGLFLALMLMKLAPHRGSGTSELVYAAEATVLTWSTIHFVPSLFWVPWAVGVGVIGHIIGDIITTAGVPVFYPLAPKLKLRLPILGDTGSRRESIFAWCCGVAVGWMVFAVVTSNHWWTLAWLTHPAAWHFAL